MSGTFIAMPVRRERRPPTRLGRSYFIRTYGCQMNAHDSERIAGLFEADGMTVADSAESADVVVFNTCCVRENADNRLYGNLGQVKALKDSTSGKRIVVAGCLAQKDRDLVRTKAPWVDVVLGTHNLGRVVDLLDHVEEWGPITEIWEEAPSADGTPSSLPVSRDVAHAAWVTIMIGCNNSCTFCIVPAVRGGEISRRVGDIVSEVEGAVADGVVEVTLLGQNVNSYGRDLEVNGRKPIFSDLLRRVGAVPGLKRIRFTSPHPKDFSEEVAHAMADTPAVCEQLHLPLQAGSDAILAAMHRGYRADGFLAKLEMARRVIPDLTVSTDIIVGFPGETEEDFQATLDVVAAARFDHAYTFQYSPRPGTAAASMPAQVGAAVVAARFQRLTDLQNRVSLQKNRDAIGRIEEVLVEGPSKKNAAMVTARTRGDKVVHLGGTYAPGTFLGARITDAAPHHMFGEVIT
ncbi:MAG: tRNA (N6-isopentenyl adenosine(37)-C2)-methylthiotransferase MiaB [Acidimicrobiia bacterium]